MINEADAPLLDLGGDGCRFRITLKPPYGRQIADQTMSDPFRGPVPPLVNGAG